MRAVKPVRQLYGSPTTLTSQYIDESQYVWKGNTLKFVERWRVRWEKLTGFIDCKQGNKDQAPHNK